MDPFPEHILQQVGRAEPATEEIKEWDANELLNWIQQKKPKLLYGDNLEKFKAAYIFGETFLMKAGNVGFFKNECNLPIGPSEILAALSSEVAGKKQDPSIDPLLIPNIRKRKASDLVASLAKMARAELQETIARSKERATKNAQVMKDIDATTLSDPATVSDLVFPFAGSSWPERFHLSGGQWQFVGREKFSNLVAEMHNLTTKGSVMALYVYGTRGYGKSHILAALVCFLRSKVILEGRQIVYIPDCRIMANDAIKYWKEALLSAWTDDETQDEILLLDTKDNIEEFIKRRKPLLIIDQLNGLEEKTSNCRLIETKEQLWVWLLRMCTTCKAIISTSANYQGYLRTKETQNSLKTFYLYGGLSQVEMEYWWMRHTDLIQDGDNEAPWVPVISTSRSNPPRSSRGVVVWNDQGLDNPIASRKKRLEDLTGCIPLYLESCIVEEEVIVRDVRTLRKRIDMEHPILDSIYNEVLAFSREVKTAKKDWELHCQFIRSCMEKSYTPAVRDLTLIDHRHFYTENQKGYVSCGAARNAAVIAMTTLGETFSPTNSLRAIAQFEDNPSVIGYMVEYAVIEALSFYGLSGFKALKQRLVTRHFLTNVPQLAEEHHAPIADRPILYIPTKFNYKSIDAVIIQVESANSQRRPKMLLYPIQITISATHEDSHKKFFEEDFQNWTARFHKYDIVPTFLWITPTAKLNVRKHTRRNREPRWPEHEEHFISLREVSMDVWSEYEAVVRRRQG